MTSEEFAKRIANAKQYIDDNDLTACDNDTNNDNNDF